jgi:hypothetical protein
LISVLRGVPLLSRGNGMPNSEKSSLGRATITPSNPVRVGSWGTWTLTYEVADLGIDDGGSIRVAYRTVSDWGIPQVDDPAADNYASVTCTNPDVNLVLSWRARANVRPFQEHLFIEVLDAPLHKGDVVKLVYGDTSGGSRGTRVQTYQQESFPFQVSVDRLGAGVYEWLLDHPTLEILPTDPDHLEVMSTGDGTVAHPVRILVRAIDKWGNPIREPLAGPVNLSCEAVATNLPDQIDLSEGKHLFERVECSGGGGYLRVSATHDQLGSAHGPPLKISGTNALHPFWGDLHGQSEETVGTNPASSYFRYARDFALNDFSGHQGNDFQITDDFWQELNELSQDLTVPGKFVVFPGYEWSGLTPIGGDRNVLFLEEGKEIRRSSLMLVQGKAAQQEGFAPLNKLYENLKQSGDECIVIPHIGGRRANLDYFDPDLEPVVEVHSCWGTFEWFFFDALRRGYRVGVVANSDGHKGRPGAEHAGAGKFGVLSGLTCILADKFDRPSLFKALKSRRCYGTSGPRIFVDAILNEEPIGSDIKDAEGPLSLNVEVAGTAGIERIDLLAAGHEVDSWIASPYVSRSQERVRIRWSGARILNRRRATEWDGSLRLEGNTLTAVEGFAFDSPAEGIQSWDSENVQWKSITTGDEDGLLLTLEKANAGSIEFVTDVMTCSVSLADLAGGPQTFEAGGIEQQVVFEWAPPNTLPREAVWEAKVALAQDLAVEGVIPLHLRITQTDGHRAWTSPWFVSV